MAEKSYNEEKRDVVKKAAKMQRGPTESTTFSMTPNTSGGTDTRTVVERDAPIAVHRLDAATEAIEKDKEKKAKKKEPTPIRTEAEEEAETEEQVQTADFEPTKVDADTVTDDDTARLEAHLSGSGWDDLFGAMDAADPVGTAVMTGLGAVGGAIWDAAAPIVKELWSKGFDIGAKPNKTAEKMVKTQKTQFGKASKDVDEVLKHNKTYDPTKAEKEAIDTLRKNRKIDIKTGFGYDPYSSDVSNADMASYDSHPKSSKKAAQDAMKTATDNLAEQGKRLMRIVNVDDMMKATQNDEILKRAKLLSETGGRAVGGAVKGAMGGALAATMFPLFMTMQKFAELGQPVPVLRIQAKAMNRPAAYHQIGPVIRRQLENDPEALQDAHDKGLITTEAFEAFQTGADFQE
tara:strand:+ start:2530 stop:3744 length:1215 start_codon:yes stop_codon:yes gene_type:complete